MLSNGVKHWFATFGHGQTHPLTGEELVYCYTLVPAETEAEAQSLMMRTVFGQQWAFLYERADGRRGAGVEQYKLREVPFIPPSPMSEVVWGAFEKIGDPERPDRWVEKVSQPIELAWYRWHAAQQDEHIRRARLRATAAAVLTPDADTLPHDPGEYDVARGIDPYAIPANRFGPPPSDLPRSAEEEQAEAASGVNDRSLTLQVAVPRVWSRPPRDVDRLRCDCPGCDRATWYRRSDNLWGNGVTVVEETRLIAEHSPLTEVLER